MKKLFLGYLFVFVLPIAAQPAERETFRVFRSEVEVQLFHFENFYQSADDLTDESVNATGAEYRAAYRRTENAPDVYGALYAIHYAADDAQTTYGGRVGVSRYGSVHSYNVWVDHAANGYAFDLEDTRAIASITTAGASYGIRVQRVWQFGVDGYHERQRFNVEDTGLENDYTSLGVQARYRGFGPIFQPRVGYVRGARDVRNDISSYDDHYWYVQLDSVPHPRVTASLRYRDRERDYQNRDRTEERAQWRLRGELKQNDRISWAASYTYENVDSSLPDRDFDTSMLYAGVVIGF